MSGCHCNYKSNITAAVSQQFVMPKRFAIQLDGKSKARGIVQTNKRNVLSNYVWRQKCL